MSEINDLYNKLMLQVWNNQSSLVELEEVISSGDESGSVVGIVLAIHGQTSIGLPGLDVVQLAASGQLVVTQTSTVNGVIAVEMWGELALDLHTALLVGLSSTKTIEVEGPLYLGINDKLVVKAQVLGRIQLNRSRIVGTNFIISADRIVPELDKSRLKIEVFRIELPLKTESGAPLTIGCPIAIFDADGITALLVVDQQGSASRRQRSPAFFV